MAKIDRVQEVSIDLLRPYERNAKIHDEYQVEKIAESIKAFGFLSPCLIDENYNIIAGHGRVLASKKLGLSEIPCVFIEGLTEEQRRAYILADNKLTEMGEWDEEVLSIELEELNDLNFDIDLTGFDFDVDDDNWFENRKRWDNDLEGETEEYKEFVEKFEAKKTTDDCYTPDEIYETIVNWVENEYEVDRKNFVRPFYPNGDYQAEKYKETDIVVDNPPFSILAEIINWYSEHGIKFFLFSPSLVGLVPSRIENTTLIVCGGNITYENGANVSTSFVTNLENEYICRTCPDLRKAIDETNAQIKKEMTKELPKYEYPSDIVHMATLQKWAKYGIDFRVKKGEAICIAQLDEQKPFEKAIYGGGLLLSTKAREEAEKAREEAEKAREEAEKAREVLYWQLSERERTLQQSIGGSNG